MSVSPVYQTDLEVILEFLEEHCRQESRRKELWENRDHFYLNEYITGDGGRDVSDHFDSSQQSSVPKAQQDPGLEADSFNSAVVLGRRDPAIPSVYPEQAAEPLSGPESTLHQRESRDNDTESLASSTPAGRGRKVRLFHFLFEMLEDPRMAHCVSWVPASAGVFCFSSTHKEHVAELWGQRKGNRRPMTYQKMSRALRNYTRSGEIIKVRKKLTYQFSVTTLTSLRSQQSGNRRTH